MILNTIRNGTILEHLCMLFDPHIVRITLTSVHTIPTSFSRYRRMAVCESGTPTQQSWELYQLVGSVSFVL